MLAIDREMMTGFEPLSDYFSRQVLTDAQKKKLAALMGLITVLKYSYGPVKRLVKPVDVKRGLDKALGYEIDIRGDRTFESHGEHYLPAADVATFKRTGVIGPYRLYSEEEAQALGDYARRLHEEDFGGTVLFGNPAMRGSLKKHGQWAINYSGMYQALRYPRFWDALADTRITQRIASLIGNDLICWRSQFFEKKPGEIGTFWHQTGTFREASARPKLEHAPDISPAAAQLTAWVALTDVTPENGCMRIIPGSYRDGRFERLAFNLKEQANDYLFTLGRNAIERAIRTLKFTTGNFIRSQLVYEFALGEVPDLFEGYATEDMAMKAGEFMIFSSLNTHGSYPNTSKTDDRLAIAGRYTTNDVKIYNGFTDDVFVTPDGEERFPVDRLGCMQLLGEDRFGHNRMATRPEVEGARL